MLIVSRADYERAAEFGETHPVTLAFGSFRLGIDAGDVLEFVFRGSSDRRDNLMIYIASIAVIGILLLQMTGSIPLASVGGSMVIGLAYVAAALALGVHEAWTNKRGALGWLMNAILSIVGALVAAPIGGMILAMLLSDGTQSLAAAGGARFSVALAAGMLITLLGTWGTLWIANRWR